MLSKNEIAIINKAEKFLNLHYALIEQGFRSKELASLCKLYPSAYSTLVNKIIKVIVSQSDRISKRDISKLFDNVNNLSEKKFYRNLDKYIETLDKRFLNLAENESPEIRKTIQGNITISLAQKLEGIYHCYYLSSFGYRIKKEPFLFIYNSKKGILEARKGNKQGPAEYSGEAYLSNNHVLTIQLSEKDTLVTDNFIAHFQLPPSYSQTLKLLRGLSISMANSFHPISRKLFLSKLDTPLDKELFNEIETEFFSTDTKVDDPIITYLQSTPNYMEILPIPNPTYTMKDLEIESRIIKSLQN